MVFTLTSTMSFGLKEVAMELLDLKDKNFHAADPQPFCTNFVKVSPNSFKLSMLSI